MACSSFALKCILLFLKSNSMLHAECNPVIEMSSTTFSEIKKQIESTSHLIKSRQQYSKCNCSPAPESSTQLKLIETGLSIEERGALSEGCKGLYHILVYHSISLVNREINMVSRLNC